MSPALLYLLLAATTPTTPPATITPTPTTTMEAPMAQAPGNQGQGTPHLSFPIRHPNQPGPNHYAAPGPGHRGAATSGGYPSATGHNTITNSGTPTPIEHTNR